ncbi:MAG: T9SS type A sorting domain-containing protein [Saprospiraceae bacterium]|nr:T9SS type A sorting domain-containing protein [Saprospiraceae bacterium]
MMISRIMCQSIKTLLPRYRDCMITNAADLKPTITLLRAEIIALENNTTLSPWIKRWLIAKYKRCLDKVIKQKSKDDRDQKGSDSTVVFLTSQPEFRYQAMAYGLIMESNDHLQARTLLNTLPYSDAGEQDFVAVQHIYLDYLADRSAYVLSNANKSFIYNAGLRQHPLAGFARAIHFTMTGQKVPVILTHLNGHTQIRSKKDIKPESKTKIYPNPTDQQSFTIDMSDFDDNTQYLCSILDIYGKVISQNRISHSKQSIDLHNIVNGIYIVKITNGDRMVHVEKLMVK